MGQAHLKNDFSRNQKYSPMQGVRPCDRQQRELHRNHIRSCDPITEQRRCIADWNTPVDPSRYPLNSEVTGEQERNAEAQDKLRNFGGRVAKMSSLIERP